MARTRFFLLFIAVAFANVAQARALRVIVERTQPEGSYERITGHVSGELDAKDPLNSIITDIQLAPRNARGEVEYTATFTLLRPADMRKASGVIEYGVSNRGGDPLTGSQLRDGMAAGHVLLASGWQGDIEPGDGRQSIIVPIAKNADGSAVTGLVLGRVAPMQGAASATLTAGYRGLLYQRPVSLDSSKALLTKQFSDDGEAIPVDPSKWAFADCSRAPFPGIPDPTKICLKDGFEMNAMYQVVYTAKDPLVLGIGFAATRDIVSYFRYEAESPIAGRIAHAVAWGDSQSGNFLRSFVQLGFNQDEAKRIVFEGVNTNIAARLLAMNIRFAIPGGAAELYQAGSEGTLWWGRHDGTSLLDRCLTTKTCPKVMETFGASEMWGLRMSPDLVGKQADADIPLPVNVRRYFFPGVTHGGGRGGFSTNVTASGACALPVSPNASSDTMRVLRADLVDWVVKGIEPPPSVYPRMDRGELVEPRHEAMGFPAIPGQPLPDHLINTLQVMYFGPNFRGLEMSGIQSLQPPSVLGVIPQLVPKTDADGNETSGIRSVLHQVPLGTYLGWNITADGYYKGRLCGFSGGYIPFARTKADREATGDPRLSLEERYATHDGYVAKVKQAAAKLVSQRLLYQEDADRIVKEAEVSGVLR